MEGILRNVLLGLLLLLSMELCGQTTFWNKFYGGRGYDIGKKVLLQADGTIVLGGETLSGDGIGAQNHGEVGSSDVVLFRIATQGITFWELCLGGSGDDYLSELIQTRDGGYLMVGTTDSRESDLGSVYGGSDVWVVKINKKGKVSWSKRFGGRGNDQGLTALELPDGYFYVAGESGSRDGSMRAPHNGGLDAWLAKLDREGNMIWQHHYGGMADEQAVGLHMLPNFECLVVGSASSTDGDVKGNRGKKDAWLFKIGEYGRLIWQRTYGGEGIDEIHGSARDANGNFYLAGTTFSQGGDIPRQHGRGDIWTLKLDRGYNILWSRTFGGSRPDGANGVCPTRDGGAVIYGTARSSDGDILLTRGYYDGIAVKVDAFGNRQWVRNFGYYGRDEIHSIVEVPKGGYLGMGYLDEPTAGTPVPGDTIDPTTYMDFPLHAGGFDFWLLNFSDPARDLTRPYITPPLLSGTVRSQETGEPVEAEITLVDNKSLDSLTSTQADAEAGAFDLLMPAYGLVSIKVLAKGYLFYGEDLRMDTVISKARIYRTLTLQPIRLGSSLVLERIFFSSGRWDLLEPSRAELERLIDFLNLNPRVRIEISGHTDNTGNRAQKQKLSEYRALAVRKYLIKRGIDGSRLRAVGKGLTQPRASNRTAEGRRRNRRVEFRVIGM
jgi:outer membrane protein OmpA-like peptidoglycan-associated protein